MTRSDSTRRRFLQLTGSAAIASLAGCSGVMGGENSESESTETTTNETTTSTEPELTPKDHKSIHIHGFLTFSINGQRRDYDQTRYYEKKTGNKHFHFHERSDKDTLWHVHSKNLSLQYALNSLPDININGKPTVTINGTTYDASDSETSIEVTVGNEVVDPKTYILKERDHVEVLIDTPPENVPTSNGSSNNTSSNGTSTQSGNTVENGTNTTSSGF